MREQCRPYLFFVVIIAACGGFLFGYHTAIISGALIFLSPAFHLTIADQGMVVSMILLGAIIGALPAGTLADKLGRRRTMAIASFFFAIGATIIAMSDSYTLLLAGRFVSGVGMGIISVAAPLYLAEVSPPQYRGRFVAAYQLAISLGILGSFIVNYLYSASGDWRWMFAVGIFPALMILMAIFFLPETPAWLFKRGMQERALKTLERLRKDKEWRNQISSMQEASSSPQKIVWTPRLRSILFIGVFLSICQQITGINTVIYYAPKIFQLAGFASTTGAILATIGIGIINVIGTLFASWVLDRAGRRPLLLIGVAGMAVCLAFLSAAYFLQSTMISEIALFSLMGYVFFFAFSLGPITWVILSEIFPMRMRGKAMTMAIFANWLFNYLISLTFLDLIQFMGSAGTFFLFALICAVAFWFTFRYIPETKGKSLEEIESLLCK